MKNFINRAFMAKKKTFLTLLSFMLLSSAAWAQSVDFIERATNILYNVGSDNVLVFNKSANKNMVQGASNIKFQITDSKNKNFYAPLMAGYPGSGIELYPDQGWQLRYFYASEQPYMGLQPTRNANDNYVGFPALEVGDVVKIVSLSDPTICALATSVEGSGVSVDKAITYRYNNANCDVNAREYTYTVTTAGKLCLNFAQNNMIYSIDVQEEVVETVKVDVDFYAQARAGLTEGTENNYIDTYTDNSVRIKENGSEDNTRFFTPEEEGLSLPSDVSIAPNSGWQFDNRFGSNNFRIGLKPTRGYNNSTPNKVGITNLAVGDIVVIKSINAPTEWSASIGTGNSKVEEYTFSYGDNSNRKININVYTYNVTTAGNMAWKFEAASAEAQVNTIISIRVYRTNLVAKQVANTYPVTITGGWASFCAPEDVELPAGVYAYIVSNREAEVLYIENANITKVPANTGVLLYSDVDGNYNLTATTGAETLSSGFVGTTARTANPNTETTFSLYDNNGTIEFWNYTGTYIPANKAYLVYGGGSYGAPAKKLRVQVGHKVPTALDEVQTSNFNNTKRIENGQLVIIRDGVKYNVQGQIVK